jgi:hypothetical protein
MENGLLFGGRFAYRDELRKNKLWLHNAETNIDIPFYFADSTTGDFDLKGIDWNIVLSYPLSNQTQIALDIFYNVDEQFKSVFPKPNSKRNDIQLRPAIAFKNNQSSLGLHGTYFNYKENIETKKYSLEQGRSPIFMRIRGLDRSLLSYAETSEERLQIIKGYGLSADMDLKHIFKLEGNFEQANTSIVDGGTYPVDQGSWTNTRLNYRADLIFAFSDVLSSDLFFTQYWLSAKGYHPTLHSQIYALGQRHIEGGLLFPYKASMNEKWEGSVSYSFHDIKREDSFLGLLHYIPSNTLHIGMDYAVTLQDVTFSFSIAYNDVQMEQEVEYDDMSGWYYDMITKEEIAYYSTDRKETEAKVMIEFPLKDKRIALTGTYKDINPINSDLRYHIAQTHIEIMF